MQRENNKEIQGFESENEIKVPDSNEKRPELTRIPSERPYYVLKEELKKYEDRKTEFKSCKNIFRVHTAADIVAPYVSAFLNTEGGILFYGIKDNGVVEGISLTRKQRDQFCLALDSNFQKFNPQITHDEYQITFKPIKDKNFKEIQDLYVIEVRVSKGKKDSLYFTHKNETYIRRDASINILKGHDLLEFYRKKQNSLVI
jgi:predicted HTH transcriptional regulator